MKKKLLERNPDAIYAGPYEREYEIWAALEIEKYYISRGFEVLVFSFSPRLEKKFPADLISSFSDGQFSKAFALQFKMPNANKDSIRWEANSAQRAQMTNNSIYYALPTFFNRLAKHQALHHLLFWHPDWVGKKDEGEKIRINSESISTRAGGKRSRAIRWGRFSEEFEICNFGLPSKAFVDSIKKSLRSEYKSAEPLLIVVVNDIVEGDSKKLTKSVRRKGRRSQR
jgi:hypothetical protein